MTDFIAGVEAADERRDIDADFAHLREIMESRSFRTNSGLAGEQPYYIYDYPPRQELEVAEHIRQLVSQLQTMTPKYDGDYAPQVLTLDLFDVVLEILGKLLRCKNPDEDVAVHLVTGHNEPGFMEAQLDGLNELASTFSQLGVNLTYEFRDTLHDRSITADTGWEILPGRGLDIFQKFVDGDWLNPLLRHQQLRRVKECKVTYQRVREK